MKIQTFPLLMLPLACLALALTGCPSEGPSGPTGPTPTPTQSSTATPNVTPVATVLGRTYLQSLRYVNGTLYGLSGDPAALIRFTDSGTSLSVNYETALPSAIFSYAHMAVTVSSGNVTFFVTNSATNQVHVYQDTGSAFAPVTSFTNGGFFGPRGVGVDGAGKVYVSDLNNGAYQIMPFQYDFAANTATALATINASAVGNLIPGAWANAGSDFYVVSNSNIASAKIYRYSGSPLAAAVSFGGSGGLSGGTDQIAVDPVSGHVFVVDSADVKRYDPSGNLIFTFTPASYPLSLAFNGAGQLYIGTLANLLKIDTP